MKNIDSNNASAIHCPCLLIAAPSSGSGKTTVTAAIAHYHTRQGLNVSVFKAGPDFIDPMILKQACQSNVYSLDFGMMSDAHCQHLLYDAARQSDLILIEGVMGLFDGKYSAADIAKRFSIPVAITVDVRAMAETFASVVYGLAFIDPDFSVWGGFANRTTSDGHSSMAKEGLLTLCNNKIRWLGNLPFDTAINFPERHLGLVQAAELQDIEGILDKAAKLLEGQAISELPPPVTFSPPPASNDVKKSLANKTIAIAQDKAFSFIYQANIDFLKERGANVIFISPLQDPVLPNCDIVYLPGGYPELYSRELSSNVTFIASLQAFTGKILAECGGMIYLSQTLTLLDGSHHDMCGLLPITVQLNKKLQSIGWQQHTFDGGTLQAHSFHYTSSVITDKSIINTHSVTSRGQQGEAIYQTDNITASYLHWYFPSSPSATLNLLN